MNGPASGIPGLISMVLNPDLEWCMVILGDSFMQTPEKLLSEEDDLIQRGLEPEMVENLKISQEAYRNRGQEMTLEEIFYFEVDDTSVLDDPELAAEREEDELLKSGFEPEEVEDLKRSQEAYRKEGRILTLEEVLNLEEDDMPVPDSPKKEKGEISPAPKKDLGQIYRQAASALTLQDLGGEQEDEKG